MPNYNTFKKKHLYSRRVCHAPSGYGQINIAAFFCIINFQASLEYWKLYFTAAWRETFVGW